MKRYWLYIIGLILIATSCTTRHYEPVQQPATILDNFHDFWDYWNKEVKLSPRFTALDQHHHIIGRDSFLSKLSTGEYLPLRLKIKDSSCYQLFNLDTVTNQSIINTIAYFGGLQYQYLQMEGKPLPYFDFTDLNGNKYNAQTCRGEIVVLNCWFIHCAACVKEMPQLNALMRAYQGRKDIIFTGLAFDSPENLRSFLSKTPFDFAIIPNEEKYLIDTLKFPEYPTDIIIGKDGLVKDVMNDYNDLEDALQKTGK